MSNLKAQVSYYIEAIDGIPVTFIRIDNKVGFCFSKNDKQYGNFVTTKHNPDEVVVFLKEEAKKMIYDKTI